LSKFQVKVYIVQAADGKIIAAKLTFLEAHELAKDFAPAKVVMVMADKSDAPNGPAYASDRAEQA